MLNLIAKLFPNEENFFEQFSKSAALSFKGATRLLQMLEEIREKAPDALRLAAEIKTIEHDADMVTHQTVEWLHKTFITPIDREDIHKLISTLDDVMDLIEAASERIVLYRIDYVPDHAIKLTQNVIQATKVVERLTLSLKNLKEIEVIKAQCVEINKLENESDHLLRTAIADLFDHETDLKRLIKLKELYELLESVTDRCEDVANLIEGIMLEYA